MPGSRCMLLLLACLGLIACGGPEFVNHPRPALKVDAAAWEPFLAECPPNEAGRHACPPESAPGALGCNVLALADDLLGGLDPAWPIARCEVHAWMHDDDGVAIVREMEVTRDYVLFSGGLFAPVYIRYVIQRHGELVLLRNRQELQAVFAPIESPEEALSLALAATGYSAYYGLQREDALEYEVDALEDTHVTATETGYEVLLYRYQVFGCGPHWTSAVEVLVEPDGSWSQARTWDAFRDPDQDGLCVD